MFKFCDFFAILHLDTMFDCGHAQSESESSSIRVELLPPPRLITLAIGRITDILSLSHGNLWALSVTCRSEFEHELHPAIMFSCDALRAESKLFVLVLELVLSWKESIAER